jgi:septal ring factor EnvC (AmiA/AmiB activator)
VTPERLAELRERCSENGYGLSRLDGREVLDAVEALQAELAEAHAEVSREIERFHGALASGVRQESRAEAAEVERDDLRAELAACVAALETRAKCCGQCSFAVRKALAAAKGGG